MTDVHTISFVATKDHWPMILSSHKGPGPNAAPRFSIRVPASVYPIALAQRDRNDGLGLMVGASSRFRPVLVPRFGTPHNFRDWEALVSQARQWNYPLNHLLLGREVEVAVSPYMLESNQFHPGGTYLDLRGIKVGGDLTKDEGLAAHIIEVQGWFK